MKNIILIVVFIHLGYALKAQFLPNQYAALESNRSKGSKSLFYKLYKLSTTSVFPYTESEYDAYLNTYGTFQLGGIANVNTSSGTLNNSTTSTYNIINFTTTSEFTSAINNSTPYSGYDGNAFAVVVSGYFIPKQSGTYYFTVEGDDAVDLFINNQNVASHYGGHGASALGTHTGSISLTAGKKYILRGRFQECAGGEYFKIFWKKPSEANGTVWYQDAEELSTEEVLPKGLVMSLDPGNWFSYPKYGSTTYDLKGNANGGMYGNLVANFSTSNGGLFYFDGDQDYIDFGKTPANFPTGDISVFVWLKASSLRSNWNIFLTKWFADLNNGGGTDFHYDIYNDGVSSRQHLYTTSRSDMFGTAFLTTNTWYQVGFTISSGNMQMYLNASLDGPVRSNAARTNNTSSSLWIGDARTGGALDFNGYIGSINIYNRALSAEEVFQNFNATKHKYGL